MSLNGWLQIAVFIAAVLLLAKPMGSFMTSVFERRRTFLDPVLVPFERLLYRVTGVNADEEMNWMQYGVAMLMFSAASLTLTYLVQRLQHVLPLNTQHLPGIPADLAFNTAVSFTTNTNWQSYVPETSMSYLTQMLGWRHITSGLPLRVLHSRLPLFVALRVVRLRRLAISGLT